MVAQTIIGIDVSRDWLDGFCLPEKQRFRFQNSPDGYARLLEILQGMPDDLKVGFEATGGQEWALWRILISMGINAVQLPPAQIKAFALSMGKRAKTDQIDAELIARFMAFRPEAGRALPDEKLQRLRALTVRRAQMVDARKRLSAQISARRKQGVSAELEDMDSTLKAFIETQISELEQRIEEVIAQGKELSAKAELLRSIPGIGPVSVAMLLAEMPELGRMTATEAAAMAGLAPMAHDSGAMHGKRVISGGRRSLRHVLFQAGLAAACHNPVLKAVARRMKERGKPHKLVIVAIARRLITIANAVLKTGLPWRISSAA
ncbi:IS110 family transposase [Acetobacter sp. P1H12_c]|uniref:IS110 family transposase n=1 Tax=Acetobacter sp. P1H12_c TaxID=2762621 RepID=UPI001C05672A|nr:IS110 family transposase [Acetobacter sp. P1H12_c]